MFTVPRRRLPKMCRGEARRFRIGFPTPTAQTCTFYGFRVFLKTLGTARFFSRVGGLIIVADARYTNLYIYAGAGLGRGEAIWVTESVLLEMGVLAHFGLLASTFAHWDVHIASQSFGSN